MNKRHKAELRAGLFLNLGLLLIMITLFIFRSNLNILSRTLIYRLELPSAEGLLVGTKVTVAGLEAGRISHLSLAEPSHKIDVQLKIEKKFSDSIREGSFAELTTAGVLGDKVVMITPGSADAPLIPPGEIVPSRPAASLSQVISQGDSVLHDADMLVQDIRRIIAGFGSRPEGKRISDTLIRTLDNLSSLSEKLNRELDIHKVDIALASLDSILGKLDHGTGTVGALINDPRLYDDAMAVVGETNQNRIVRNLVRQSVENAKEGTQKAGQSGQPAKSSPPSS